MILIKLFLGILIVTTYAFAFYVLHKMIKSTFEDDMANGKQLSQEGAEEILDIIGEKQIQIDAEQIRALQKDKGELTDKVKELEAQIEKMKRYLDCEYCEHYTQSYGCKNCNEEIRSDWKLKEKK